MVIDKKKAELPEYPFVLSIRIDVNKDLVVLDLLGTYPKK
jgi:hypothetical protein